MDGSAPMTRSATSLTSLNHIAVAVPVRNEATRLPKLLSALDVGASIVPVPVTVTLLINNTTDASAKIARRLNYPALSLQVLETEFSQNQASAGHARGMAMRVAASQGGLLMTTDADAIPDPMWMISALMAMAGGADLVCGRITARVPRVMATPSGGRITRAEFSYATMMHEVRHYLDQMAGRQAIGSVRPHYMESGACMAMRVQAFLAVGGLPDRPCSEDRAMVYRAETAGLVVNYCDGMRARVSGRLRGRAAGGMAECLRQRMQDEDPYADQAMLSPKLLAQLWSDAMYGSPQPYPDRSTSPGPRMRASDLETALPLLAQLTTDIIRPQFAEWLSRKRVVAA